MHVDRLFDVGLYLIEELARCTPLSIAQGKEDEWGTVGHWLAFGCHSERVVHPDQSSRRPCFWLKSI